MHMQAARRFAKAAQQYEQHARVQKQAASQFDNWLAGLNLLTPNSIAEIGCGTGFLSRLLYKRYPTTTFVLTDLAPGMVEHCRANFAPSERLRFQVCDGRSARFTPSADWIVSTMCFQWFDPLAPVLAHHFEQSRVLAFSILLDGSFSKWRAAHAKSDCSAGLQALPHYDDVRSACSLLDANVHVHRISLTEWHDDGISFANSLRVIGADLPRPQHQPVNLKAVCKHLKNGFAANYEIGFFCIEKDLNRIEIDMSVRA